MAAQVGIQTQRVSAGFEGRSELSSAELSSENDDRPGRGGFLVGGMLAVSEKTWYSWVGRGELPYVKIGSAVRMWLRGREYLPRSLH